MKSSSRKLVALAAIAAAATTFFSQAQAASVSFVATGGPGAVGVDIFANGLTEALGGFQFQLEYDTTQLTFVNFSTNPAGKMGVTPLDFSDGNNQTFCAPLTTCVDFFVLADGSLTQPALFALQGSGGGPFEIGHVDFTAAAPGPYTLGLTNVVLSNFCGQTIGPNEPPCITGGTAPEPTTALLVAAALGALALRRKQSQA